MNEKEFIMWLKGYLEGTLSNSDFSAENKTLSTILDKIKEIETPGNRKYLLSEQILSPYSNNKSNT